MALSTTLSVALIARILLGAGDAAIFPGVVRLIQLWFPLHRGPMMTQLTALIGQSGQLVSVLPLAMLLGATSWSIAFGGVAALCVLCAVVVWVLVRSQPHASIAETSVAPSQAGAPRLSVVRDEIREAWRTPGTRLAFWYHFTPSFAGTTFVLLWGVPYLTAGEGLSTVQAAGLITLFVVGAMLAGPLFGELSRRFPRHRSYGLVLPTVCAQTTLWLAVVCWPGPAPVWLLVPLMIALAAGGSAAMVAFDEARVHNPRLRLSTSMGVVSSGGFIAALIAVFLIGLALDLQGAGSPDAFTLETLRLAFLTQLPLWLAGSFFIWIERRRVLAH